MDRAGLENRAVLAKRFLEDQTFIEVLETMEQDYIKQSLTAQTLEEREEARRYVHVIRSIPSQFQSFVNAYKYKEQEQ